MPAARPDLSVIIPTHNEGTVEGVVRTVAAAFFNEPIEIEIIVVDDGSTRGAPVGVSRQIDTKTTCVVARHDVRRGSGAARKTGAALARGAWHAWIDGDGTYAAADLHTLWRLRRPGTQSIGWRQRETGTLRAPRWAAKLGLRLLVTLLWGRRIRDLNSGLRLLPREHFEAWGHELPDGFSCATAATLGALQMGHPILYVPIRYEARTAGADGSKFHPIRDSFRMLCQILGRRFTRRRKTNQPGTRDSGRRAFGKSTTSDHLPTISH